MCVRSGQRPLLATRLESPLAAGRDPVANDGLEQLEFDIIGCQSHVLNPVGSCAAGVSIHAGRPRETVFHSTDVQLRRPGCRSRICLPHGETGFASPPVVRMLARIAASRQRALSATGRSTEFGRQLLCREAALEYADHGSQYSIVLCKRIILVMGVVVLTEIF